MSVPHKAFVGDIVTHVGYPGSFYVVTSVKAVTEYDEAHNRRDTVSYTVRNVDKGRGIMYATEKDIAVHVFAKDADKWMESRRTQQPTQQPQQPTSNLPQVPKPPVFDVMKFLEEFRAKKEAELAEKNKPKTDPVLEEARKRKVEREKRAAYIDFILDWYLMLASAKEETGALSEDGEATLEVIREEFMEKTEEMRRERDSGGYR